MAISHKHGTVFNSPETQQWAVHGQPTCPTSVSPFGTVTPRIPIRPDWRIRTSFRDARLRTGTLYLIFFFKTELVPVGMAHILSHNQNLIYIYRVPFTYTKLNFYFTNQSTEPTCSEPLQVCWPSCMQMFADVFTCTYTD